MKRWLIVLGVLAAMAVAGALLLLLAIDPVAGWVFQNRATATLGTPVTLEHARVGLLAGELQLTGVRVASLPGYGSQPMFLVGAITARLAPSALLMDPLPIDEIVLNGLLVHVEKGPGGSNVEVLRARLRLKLAAEKGSGRRALVKRFVLRGARASVPGPVPLAPRMTVPLKDVVLNDVGKDQGGIRLLELSEIVFGAVKPALGRLLHLS